MSNSQRIAVTHPGKIGDVIYACSVIKELSNKYGPVDFFTSEYCRPLKELLEYQPWINSFNIPDYYSVDNFGCGGQPWLIPVKGYENIIHLGFREFPTLPLDIWYWSFLTGDLDNVPPFLGTFECPVIIVTEEPYIVIAARKDEVFRPFFKEFINNCPIKTIQIGTTDEFINGTNSINMTGLNLLETTSIISNASGFFGVLSALAGIAQSFNIRKVLLGSGAGWDMRHVRRTTDNLYPTYPPERRKIFNFLKLENSMKTYSKTLNVLDYDSMSGHAQHIKSMQGVLSGLPVRFEHEHRLWEYALAYKAVDENGSESLLDVGGGGSIFAPAMAWVGKRVTVVDPGDVGSWIKQQKERTGKDISFEQSDFMNYNREQKFDAVICLSVLEHIPNDVEFFTKLMDNVKSGGILVLTVDFHPSGTQIVSGHVRAYNKRGLTELISIAEKNGFSVVGNPEYDYFEPNVNGCTFAALVLKKNVTPIPVTVSEPVVKQVKRTTRK